LFPTLVHTDHFIFARAVPSSASASSTHLTYSIVPSGTGISVVLCAAALASEIDWLKFSPLARPYSQRGHQDGTTYLESPPEDVCWDSVRIQRSDDEVNEVYSDGEVKDELGARDQEQDEDDTIYGKSVTR
jgi:hypothetical protein